MVSPFTWAEIFLYILPFALFVYVKTYLKPHFHRFSYFPLHTGTLLIPAWMIFIVSFSYLIYSINIFSVIWLIITFILALLLYDYIRYVDVFYMRLFLDYVMPYIFGCLSLTLFTLMFLRLYSIFFYHP